jgi:DNA modification methylase
MNVTRYDDGVAINGDCMSPEVIAAALEATGGSQAALVLTDPPYGNVVVEDWDRTDMTDVQFVDWMLQWTSVWKDVLLPRGAFYVWGGLGTRHFRPFLRYLVAAEATDFQLANVITWSKKRAYGVQNNYLYTREELAYFVKGDAKKPRVFNVPLLEEKRGYAGYNEKYPAKSEFYRRTNVWMDVNEIFRGKVHPTQKPQRVMEIPIEVHTNPGEYVVDMFAGSGSTAVAARKLGRKFVVIEKDPDIFQTMLTRLSTDTTP